MQKQIYANSIYFHEIIDDGGFYVDKTLFVKELLENISDTSGITTLISRPKGFGKTMNMSMLRSFFDINRNSMDLFKGLAISEYKDICEEHMNKHPLIYLTFQNMEFDEYPKAITRIKIQVSGVFRQNLRVYESDVLSEEQKDKFYSYYQRNSTDEELQVSLQFLAECLYAYHKKPAIILLDAYDCPLESAETFGYYQDYAKYLDGFFASIFKGNEYLKFGVLAGVHDTFAKELVNSFDNLRVFGTSENSFATYFGFTEDEVKAACETYQKDETFDENNNWYDVHNIGGQNIFNPSNIAMYLDGQIYEIVE
ncbi:MAG: AAA family ATPase [Oscillospiraceae bacterium]|nr:AAA family ATPase [Oscillospiraceae bacterium]